MPSIQSSAEKEQQNLLKLLDSIRFLENTAKIPRHERTLILRDMGANSTFDVVSHKSNDEIIQLITEQNALVYTPMKGGIFIRRAFGSCLFQIYTDHRTVDNETAVTNVLDNVKQASEPLIALYPDPQRKRLAEQREARREGRVPLPHEPLYTVHIARIAAKRATRLEKHKWSKARQFQSWSELSSLSIPARFWIGSDRYQVKDVVTKIDDAGLLNGTLRLIKNDDDMICVDVDFVII